MTTVDINYSMDASERDDFVREIAEGRDEVRMRLQPNFLVDGNYRAWSGVSWVVKLQNADEAIALRESMKAFFAAVGRSSALDVRRVLEGI